MSFLDFPNEDDGDDAAPASGAPQAGYPIAGHPAWRAGVPGADNVLGVVQVPPVTGGQGAAPVAGAPWDAGMANFTGPNDPRLMQVADQGQADPSGALDYERNSWRWNDPDALNYDMQRKQEELAEAQGLANGADAVAGGQLANGVASKVGRGVAAANSLGLTIGGFVLGESMNRGEIPMLQNEIQAIQGRLAQLRGTSSS
jgi:hypothetical protein